MSPFGPRRRSTSRNESSENSTCTGKLDAVRNLSKEAVHTFTFTFIALSARRTTTGPGRHTVEGAVKEYPGM